MKGGGETKRGRYRGWMIREEKRRGWSIGDRMKTKRGR